MSLDASQGSRNGEPFRALTDRFIRIHMHTETLMTLAFTGGLTRVLRLELR